jgi:hypothetical protein
MKEEYYAALSHRLTCNKNKSLKCMRLLNEREREREHQIQITNHQLLQSTYVMHKSHFAMLLILRKKANLTLGWPTTKHGKMLLGRK